MNIFRSIRYKFIAVLLIIFLLFSGIVLDIWYRELKQEAQNSAIQNMEHLLKVSNTIFENQVRDVINVTALSTVRSSNHLSTNIINIMSRDNLTDAEIIAYRKAATDYLISLCSFKKNLNGLMLCDFNGNNICYGVPTPYEMLKDNGSVDEIKNTDEKTIFLIPHYPKEWYRTDKDLAFSILKPVYGLNGKKIGFAIADLSCQLFQDCYDVGSSASLYVLDTENGEILFRPTQNLLHMESLSFADDAFLQNFTANAGHFFVTSSTGQQLLVVYRKSDLTNWTTLSVIPEADIISAFTNTAHKISLITVALLVLLVAAVFLSTTLLTRNIRILTNAVKSIDGDHLEITPLVASNDEVGILAVQFQAMLDRIRQLLSEILEKETARHKAELSALQFQMNPHFLYNTLNTIKFLANIQGIDNISEVAESLSSLMHTNMDGRTFLSVNEDVAFIRCYLQIQNYRFTNTFHAMIDASPDCGGYLIPKLIVQPLIENCLKHGLKDVRADGIIKIRYFSDEGDLRIVVEDNGCGMSETRINEILSTYQSTNAGHIGLRNINERLHMYYGMDYGLEIISQPGLFTRFEITLPITEQSDPAQENERRESTCTIS